MRPRSDRPRRRRSPRAPGPLPPGARSAIAARSSEPATVPPFEIDGRQPVGRGGDHEPAVVGHEQVVDGVVDGRQRLDGRRPDAHPADGDRGQVERRDAGRRRSRSRAGCPSRRWPARRAPAAGIGRDRAGGCAGRRCGSRSRSRRAGARRPCSPGASSSTRRGSTATARTGALEVARRADVVPAPQDETAGHRVLREVRVGPLVDVVGQAVAPVLEELGRRPRVVDLVEVHLVRLGEPERAQQHRPDHEQDHEQQVELVQPAATLRAERRAAVGRGRAARPAAP